MRKTNNTNFSNVKYTIVFAHQIPNFSEQYRIYNFNEDKYVL